MRIKGRIIPDINLVKKVNNPIPPEKEKTPTKVKTTVKEIKFNPTIFRIVNFWNDQQFLPKIRIPEENIKPTKKFIQTSHTIRRLNRGMFFKDTIFVGKDRSFTEKEIKYAIRNLINNHSSEFLANLSLDTFFYNKAGKTNITKSLFLHSLENKPKIKTRSNKSKAVHLTLALKKAYQEKFNKRDNSITFTEDEERQFSITAIKLKELWNYWEDEEILLLGIPSDSYMANLYLRCINAWASMGTDKIILVSTLSQEWMIEKVFPNFLQGRGFFGIPEFEPEEDENYIYTAEDDETIFTTNEFDCDRDCDENYILTLGDEHKTKHVSLNTAFDIEPEILISEHELNLQQDRQRSFDECSPYD